MFQVDEMGLDELELVADHVMGWRPSIRKMPELPAVNPKVIEDSDYRRMVSALKADEAQNGRARR